ncbi:MAG: DegT/DnrJ/EryC1/StrS family aminotransferase [Kiritimatiellae bacterium]|jgi:dTDP-4-amino-4,6-dideoxygalactose transaminase|nr:DegT/DnrJ/EryC1/StrS family aminotransferase [Kiritimatiellia bacterium]
MSFKIPLFDLNYGADEIQALTDTINDNWISTGPRCEKFEADFAKALRAPYALTADNCTNALFMALLALDIGPGDEVLVPSLTFVATANTVKYVGATPVFCDILGYDNLCISPEEIESKITSRTKAVTVMHYAGFPCDMDAIMAIARKHNIRVIEDACHGPLSEYQSQSLSMTKKLGTIGDIGCFSFFSNKNISTGEGGMLICKDEVIYKRLKLLRSHGMTTTSYQRAGGHSTKYDVVSLGYNFRMDDLRAALGIVQLGKLKTDLVKRAQVRQWYEELLEDTPNIIVPFSAFHVGRSPKPLYSNYIFPVMLKQGGADHRDIVRDRLHAAGVQTSVHYPAAHRFSIYQSCHANLPLTEFAADHLITLPMYSQLSKDDVKFVAEGLINAVES